MISVKELKRKICVLGDWGVGKTSLIRKFVLDQFDDSYLATFGTKSTKKRIIFKKDDSNMVDLTLIIWDVMGQQEFKKIQTLAYAGTQAAFIVCDITRKETLYDTAMWQLDLYNITQEIPIIVLANKADLKNEAEITEDDLKEVTEGLHAPCFFTSAKTGENVEKAFLELSKKMLQQVLVCT